MNQGFAFANQVAKPLSRDIASQCGVDFSVPRKVNVMLVQTHITDPSVRCTLALISAGRKHSPIERGITEGYYEEADLVLLVKAAPVADQLITFNFAPPVGLGRGVRYIGFPLTDTAKRMGYEAERVSGFSVTGKGEDSLYVADVVVRQKPAKGLPLQRRRLDILWGNNDISVGATIWCVESKLRNCDFQEAVRTLFSTMSEVHPR